jgi:hyaluronan synthase
VTAPLPEARRSRPAVRAAGVVGIVLVVAMVFLAAIGRGLHTPARVVFVLLAFTVLVQVLLALAGTRTRRRTRSGTGTGHESADVVVLVPVYNEDPEALRRCLAGMLRQSRLPDAIAVIDDGTTAVGYAGVRAWFAVACAGANIRMHWVRTPNRGKRHAQITGVELEPAADVYVTVDSDTILDTCVIEHGLAPFADQRVQSVAALILTANYRQSFLARMMDLYCLGLQLFERSAFSRLGAVMVNSGAAPSTEEQ